MASRLLRNRFMMRAILARLRVTANVLVRLDEEKDEGEDDD